MTPVEQKVIQRAWDTGHFWSQEALKEGGVLSLSDLKKVKVTDPVVVAALRSLSQSESVVYSSACEHIYGRQPVFDGAVGPAMAAMVQVPRCYVPDVPPPPNAAVDYSDPDINTVARMMQDDSIRQATGSGNWAHCHGVGDYHSAVVRVKTSGTPSFLKPVFSDVLKRVQKGYAGIGLLFHFIDENKTDLLTGEEWSGAVNIEFSFVSSSSGWIGLAIVGNGQGCTSNIWCRYLSTYRGGSSADSIARQWTSLIAHELGHNCGLDHSRGGVMNSSIVNNLPDPWVDSDPSTRILKSWYGGEPVPMDKPEPPAPPKPDRIDELEKRVDQVEAKLLAQLGVNQYLLSRISDLENS